VEHVPCGLVPSQAVLHIEPKVPGDVPRQPHHDNVPLHLLGKRDRREKFLDCFYVPFKSEDTVKLKAQMLREGLPGEQCELMGPESVSTAVRSVLQVRKE